MTDDNLFRIILVGLVVLVFPFALLSRIRSSTHEKLDRWQEGTFIFLGLRLSAIPCLISVVVWLINPEWMQWSAMPLPSWLRWCGLGLLLAWAVLLPWTFLHLGKNLTDTVVTREQHSLVKTGPYRYVRHPFYLAFFLLVLGGSLTTANWFHLLSGLLPAAFLVLRTKTEEDKLIERFGAEYRDYMAHTRRFFPLPRRTVENRHRA